MTNPAATPSTRKCAARPKGPYGIDAKAQCRQQTHRATAALCSKHEKQWRIESKARAAARRAQSAEAAAAVTPEAFAADDALDQSLTARNRRALVASRRS